MRSSGSACESSGSAKYAPATAPRTIAGAISAKRHLTSLTLSGSAPCCLSHARNATALIDASVMTPIVVPRSPWRCGSPSFCPRRVPSCCRPTCRGPPAIAPIGTPRMYAFCELYEVGQTDVERAARHGRSHRTAARKHRDGRVEAGALENPPSLAKNAIANVSDAGAPMRIGPACALAVPRTTAGASAASDAPMSVRREIMPAPPYGVRLRRAASSLCARPVPRHRRECSVRCDRPAAAAGAPLAH